MSGLSRPAMAIIGTVVIVPAAVAATAYKCVDADGATYFSDKQCPGSQEQSVVDIKPAPAPAGAEMDAIKERQERQQRILDAAAKDRHDRRREREEEREKQRAADEAICKEHKARLEKLESRQCTRFGGCTVYALTKEDEEGNVVIASEREKREEIERLKRAIAGVCK